MFIEAVRQISSDVYITRLWVNQEDDGRSPRRRSARRRRRSNLGGGGGRKGRTPPAAPRARRAARALPRSTTSQPPRPDQADERMAKRRATCRATYQVLHGHGPCRKARCRGRFGPIGDPETLRERAFWRRRCCTALALISAADPQFPELLRNGRPSGRRRHRGRHRSSRQRVRQRYSLDQGCRLVDLVSPWPPPIGDTCWPEWRPGSRWAFRPAGAQVFRQPGRPRGGVDPASGFAAPGCVGVVHSA
jgi:hypothetical protein